MQRTSQAPELLSAKKLADLLGCSLQTVYNWRDLDRGPIGFRLGGNGQLRYLLSDVLEWLDNERSRELKARRR